MATRHADIKHVASMDDDNDNTLWVSTEDQHSDGYTHSITERESSLFIYIHIVLASTRDTQKNLLNAELNC